MSYPLEVVTPELARAAARRIEGLALRTPLVPLQVDDAPARIWLKLECLQPIRSFKLRGAANAMLSVDPERLRDGVWTASAGNMAQGVAWCARRMEVPCVVVVPEGAPETKLAAIRRLGAEIVFAPFERWFEIYETRRYEGMRGMFVHAFSDADVMAGNATLALEILEDLPDPDAVVIPYGGGGLACGIASVLRMSRPEIRRLAAEVTSAAPLAAALEAGEPVPIEHRRTFVDGIGGPRLFAEMWELARRLLDGVVTAEIPEICAAIRLLVERHAVVAEGGGAAPLAAALAGRAGAGKVVCVVSGGNLDPEKLATILGGGIP